MSQDICPSCKRSFSDHISWRMENGKLHDDGYMPCIEQIMETVSVQAGGELHV